ncbi:hypothetical protein BDW22DRAFT_1358100 [Trametopsis cervina]|nr:hypothetical protein BDW22DRAFT_1358100 [Trametopsis cervina]
MSAVGSPPPPDLMRTYMLRSNTPASNEKVLLYLEGMQKAPPEDDDRASSVRSSKHPRSQLSRGPASIAEEDVRSDIQEMNQSEVARTIPIHTVQDEIPDHEPGPNDPPGPKFESYGSSFGNFGPLRDSLPPVNNWNGNAWTSPSKAAGIALPETVVSPGTQYANPFQEFGMAPLDGANVPLPASVTSGPSRKTGQPSQKAPSVGNDFLSPKSAARPMSPPRTTNGNEQSPERAWSPRSGMSPQPSRITQKSSRSAYPPLPESTMEDPMMSRISSPPARSMAKTPSVAPSDSASQRSMAKQRKTPQKEPSHKPSRSVRSQSEMNGVQAEPMRSTVSRGAPSHREDARSQAMSPRSQASRALSQRTNEELFKAASAISATRSHKHNDPEITPTPSRPASPLQDLNAEEQRLVNEFLTRPAGARTSYAQSAMAPSTLEPEIQNSHFHDGELCQLLHALDQPMADPVKKAIRKAVRARVKRLGMKYDNESIRQYRKSYHDHNPAVHLTGELAAGLHQLAHLDEPPEWAKSLLENVAHLTAKVDRVDTKVDKVVELRSSRGGASYAADGRSFPNGQHDAYYAHSESRAGYPQSEMNQSGMQPQTELDDDMYTDAPHHDDHGAVEEDEFYGEDDGHLTTQDGETRGGLPSDYNERDNSPGQQFLEEELYKLRVKPTTGSQSVATHKTWEVARDDGGDFDEGDTQAAVTESGLPEIPDTHTGNYPPTERSLPPVPRDTQSDMLQQQPVWPAAAEFTAESRGPPPWQRIHQRLLNWAIVWPMSELEHALNSTTRGHQVDEVALSIWSTQSYKRYVRSRMTESPPERVDRLFVPPNMAEAISTAVYNGRHGDACGMLRELWAPFGLEGIPRLLVVLAKHRNDDNHWVVHRFSLPDGSLTTYDTYPEKSLPDGRPLGWWFAIRIAWPDFIYPSPDRLMQKMVRLHRPMQLAIDNSVAAAGIWRNILMASRAERSLDLERLRDLINQEVKNLRQRKVLGKLSIGSPRPNWEDMH